MPLGLILVIDGADGPLFNTIKSGLSKLLTTEVQYVFTGDNEQKETQLFLARAIMPIAHHDQQVGPTRPSARVPHC
jgi:hypothetical protein